MVSSSPASALLARSASRNPPAPRPTFLRAMPRYSSHFSSISPSTSSASAFHCLYVHALTTLRLRPTHETPQPQSAHRLAHKTLCTPGVGLDASHPATRRLLQLHFFHALTHTFRHHRGGVPGDGFSTSTQSQASILGSLRPYFLPLMEQTPLSHVITGTRCLAASSPKATTHRGCPVGKFLRY